jgi:eukaryotic-like serine/threonine-protein kinase
MTMSLRPGDGTRIGGYDLVGRLGEGGMGTVYLARDRTGRRVAIKTVRSDYADDGEFRGRFRSEVNRARQVPPFCTAEVLDADPDHDPPYLVVEYVDGPSLATTVRDDGPLSGAALHGVAVGIATALTAIHGAEVIHRDLKPANVLVAPGGIKVIDFGIARAFEATSLHTRTDQMVGTVAYMAPERFDPAPGRPVTPAADVFAWGAVVTYAATGRTPFGADSAPATAMRILTQEPDLSGLPASLRDPVHRSLAKNPEDRPTARELLDMLVAAVAPGAAPPRTAGAPTAVIAPAANLPGAVPPVVFPPTVFSPDSAGPRRRRSIWPFAVAALVAAVLIGFAVPVLRANRASDLPEAAPSTAPATSAPAATPASASAAAPPPVDTQAAMLRGERRALIHVVEIDRDLALDFHDAKVTASNGIGAKSLFLLVPYGVDYLIRTLRAGSDDEECLGVKIIPDGDASLAPAQCAPTKSTIFSLTPTGRKDDKARPTYRIQSQAYGFVQYNRARKTVYVQEVGDADPLSSFSLVDRGPE